MGSTVSGFDTTQKRLPWPKIKPVLQRGRNLVRETQKGPKKLAWTEFLADLS
jgi:hypothetical protein